MKHPTDSIPWLRPALAGLALFCATSLGLAQGTSATNTFDTASSTTSFVTWWGPPSPTMTWDATLDAGGDPNSGSVRYEEPFTGTAGEQFMTFFTIANGWGWDRRTVLDATAYTNLSFDIRVDPSSGQRKANNDYGYLEIGLVTYVTDWGQTAVGAGVIPLSANGNWVHISYPLNAAMANIDQVVGFFIKMWSDGAHTNTLIFNVDNFMITQPTAPVVIPPPTMAIQKAGPSGVMITMDDDSYQWQRNAIATPSGGGPYLWTSQGSYPVSYSFTIVDFPAIAAHRGFEAHMYLVNGDTTGAGNQTAGAPDWNCPDLLIFRVENIVSTSYTTNGTTITTNFTDEARAQIQWKTNFANANATNVPVNIIAPSALGTWTVTFTDATHGALTGPGITATNFTLPDDAVLNNFSPLTSFLQFGMFKNDGPNDGHNNQAHGTFSRVQFTGAAAAFDDNFDGPTLTNKYVWRKTSASAVQHVAPGTAWMVDWTLPANDFNAQSASIATGPWTPAVFSTTYQSGNKVHNMVSASALPSANAGLYRLIKRPFEKLQVLMPGETAAPGTPTGKTGTPDPQAVYVPFNITVNAVDADWNRVRATDTIMITSSDISATLPADAALVGGTATFSVTFNTAGTWTVTATDVTDTSKTPNTGSPTVAQ
ncbi:MAG TPA: hypothetical protein VJA21_20430 [Verrucomicrobiae bacterium]